MVCVLNWGLGWGRAQGQREKESWGGQKGYLILKPASEHKKSSLTYFLCKSGN